MRLTTDQIRLMAAFESLTGVLAKDCIIENGVVVFIVNEREIGKAIGKKGQNVKRLEQILGKRVEVVGYSEDLVRFFKNIFHPAHILAVSLSEKNGRRVARVHVDKEALRILQGKMEKKMKLAKTLAKRYFNIDNVAVV